MDLVQHKEIEHPRPNQELEAVRVTAEAGLIEDRMRKRQKGKGLPLMSMRYTSEEIDRNETALRGRMVDAFQRHTLSKAHEVRRPPRMEIFESEVLPLQIAENGLPKAMDLVPHGASPGAEGWQPDDDNLME